MTLDASGPTQLRIRLCSRCNYQFLTEHIPIVPNQVFRDNSPFSGPEVQLQDEMLAFELRELERYKEEIDNLGSILKRLKRERDGLLHRYNRRRASLSSFRKLPVELLEKILLEACYPQEREEDDSNSGPFYPIKVSGTSNRAIPLVLSSVCVRWRQAIVGHSCFWTSFCIEWDQIAKQILSTPIFWGLVGRSQNKPLRIRVDTRRTQPGVLPQATEFLRDIIMRASNLQLSCAIFWKKDLKQGLSPLSLKSLTLINHDSDACPQALLDSPGLAKVFVHGRANPLREVTFPPQITAWRPWGIIDISDLLCFSQMYPRLQELCLDLTPCAGLFYSPLITEVCFPLVERLEFTLRVRNQLILVDSLHFPRLKHLAYRFYDLWGVPCCSVPPSRMFVSFLRRSTSFLETLDIVIPNLYMPSDPKWLVDALSSSYALTTLRIVVCKGKYEIPEEHDHHHDLSRLLGAISHLLSVSNESGAVYVPNLDTLNIDFEIFEEEDRAVKGAVEGLYNAMERRASVMNARLGFTLPAATEAGGIADIEFDGGVVLKRGERSVIAIRRPKDGVAIMSMGG